MYTKCPSVSPALKKKKRRKKKKEEEERQSHLGGGTFSEIWEVLIIHSPWMASLAFSNPFLWALASPCSLCLGAAWAWWNVYPVLALLDASISFSLMYPQSNLLWSWSRSIVPCLQFQNPRSFGIWKVLFSSLCGNFVWLKSLTRTCRMYRLKTKQKKPHLMWTAIRLLQKHQCAWSQGAGQTLHVTNIQYTVFQNSEEFWTRNTSAPKGLRWSELWKFD